MIEAAGALTADKEVIVVGLGSGDKSLLTLAAVAALKRAQVAVAVQHPHGFGMAHAIAEEYLSKQVEWIPMPLRMNANNQAVYRQTAKVILQHLPDRGPVVILCEGDPSFYASASYVLTQLQSLGLGADQIGVIPGIASPFHAAAMLQRPLCRGDEDCVVVPASRSSDQLGQDLAKHDNVVIMKLGRHTARVWSVIEAAKRLEHCGYVSHLGQPNQRVLLAPAKPPEPCYFSMFVVGLWS